MRAGVERALGAGSVFCDATFVLVAAISNVSVFRIGIFERSGHVRRDTHVTPAGDRAAWVRRGRRQRFVLKILSDVPILADRRICYLASAFNNLTSTLQLPIHVDFY